MLKTRTGYNAFSPLVDGCAVTEKTVDRALARIKQALAFHLEGQSMQGSRKGIRLGKALRDAIEEYDTDALYAAVRVAA